MYSKLYKVKEGKVDAWREWGRELVSKNKDVAIKTLELENVIDEAFFLFEIEGCFYSFAYMIVDEEFSPITDHPLNKLHKQKIKECLEPFCEPELVYRLTQRCN